MSISNFGANGIRPGVCTSTTRPSNPYLGQLIFETDTFALMFWNGSAWQNPTNSTPTGTINVFASNTIPAGWLLCAGQTVSRSTYANLFSVIGTSYGIGDGSTTFALPDLRGRTVAGLDNMGGMDAGRLDWTNLIGIAGGSQTHTLAAAESGVQNHTHNNYVGGTNNFATAGHTHGRGDYHAAVGATNSDASRIGYQAGGVYTNPSTYSVIGSSLVVNPNFNHNTPVYGTSGTASANASFYIINEGSGNLSATSPHNNMQPTMLLNYIIKV